ncbi:hypothetical protein PV755_40700 [Streptomyces caniscabiei]|uniref:Uncharacterized protein n=1 Tax=Streptomyces caniscabiei TaxID=2746961 RepID=A0A927KZ26_9ACTN|nr:hypothetical protein [Streptomyces caniscabiei]MBD9722492.1 hypothetical protein [Streptomyces caniscabiei]MDX3515163.1 hypothetical protein [Streptomyces caniscabiei]MDX3716555.1 hypothetical protein [Streptomyces caniscabiei]WEO22447.1 hypothetical protein IHE65_04445 [Streptomyces caniscabiei]
MTTVAGRSICVRSGHGGSGKRRPIPGRDAEDADLSCVGSEGETHAQPCLQLPAWFDIGIDQSEEAERFHGQLLD